MKKILFFAAVLATALVSCSSDDSNALEVAKTPAMNEVNNLGMKAAGTTMTITSGAATRTVNGNNVTSVGDKLTITIAPVTNGSAYTLAASTYSLKVNPWYITDKNEKKSYFGGNINADIEEANKANNYIVVNSNNISLEIDHLDKLFDGTAASYFKGAQAIPATCGIDEWTYEVWLYPQVISTDLDPETGMPTYINNPLTNIMNDESKDLGNLIGKRPFIKREASKEDIVDRWGNSYPRAEYMEAQPDTLITDNYLIRTMVYQGECNPTVAEVPTQNRAEYEYKYGYIKCAIHVQPKPAPAAAAAAARKK